MRDECGSSMGANESPRQERSDLFRHKRTKDHTLRSITAPIICPGGYPVKVAFRSPETSRYLVRMWGDGRAIGKWAKVYRGRVQGNKFIQSRSRREKVNTRQSRGTS